MNRRERLGSLLAQLVAERIGTWSFVLWQAGLMAAWFVYNAKAPQGWRIDPPPYLLGNIIMSIEAAFTGPVLLIAASHQGKKDRDRDHRIEKKLDKLLERP